MPLTLEKLFSPTATVSFPFLGETVNVTWAPFRYTGEMQDLWQRMMNDHEEQTEAIRALRQEAETATAQADELEAAAADDGEAPEALVQVLELRRSAAKALDEVGTHELRLDRGDKQVLKETLSKVVVGWDVLGADGKPIPTDMATLNTLPDAFLWAVFQSLSAENQADPTNAPDSDEPSSTEKISAPSPTGTRTSRRAARSASRRSSSTNGRTARVTTRSGATGR